MRPKTRPSNVFGTKTGRVVEYILTRVQTGLRVERHLLLAFRKLCKTEGYGFGRVVEEFMRASVQTKSVKVALDGIVRLGEAQRFADETFLKAKMADVESLVASGRTEMETSRPMSRVDYEGGVSRRVKSILSVLPRINDADLRKEAAQRIEKAMKYVEEERLYNARIMSVLG